MKISARRFITLFTVVCLLFSFVSLPVSAADPSDARFTKKIVSVLFDNSGSMETNNRDKYALYSLQTLMSLLNSEDSLSIVPMNGYSPIEIDLSSSDRNAQVEKALNETFLKNDPDGGTPHSSIGRATNELIAKGLKSKNELMNEDSGNEYWLVILTDGIFGGIPEGDAVATAQCIEGYIAEYPSLNTIYLGFVDAVDLTGSSLCDSYKFTPHIAKDTNSIINVMRDIANLLSGRFTMPDSVYSVNGNTVTVDLNKYEYSLKSISVIAQNCGAAITSAKYNSNSVTPSQPCILKPDKILNIAAGYSAVLKAEPYFSGGTITMEFSAPVDAEMLSILAEPALSISAYIECKDGDTYKRVDPQYISANMHPGDMIRIGYEVTEMSSGSPIDISKLFGKAESKVIYANNSYSCIEDFPLVLGTNNIGVTVSVMDGKFVMHDSIKCVVEEDPTHFRIEATFDDIIKSNPPKTRSVYTVFSNNVPLTKSEIEAYGIEITLKDASGADIPFEQTIGSDGRITVTADISSYGYGVYSEYIKVTSPAGIFREHTHSSNYYPTSIDVKLIAGDGMTMKESELSKGYGEIKFELTADGKPLSFDSGIVDYKLMFADADVAGFASVSDNILTYVPRTIDTGKGALTPGEITITLTATLKNDPSVTDSAEVKFTLTPSIYEVKAISSPDKKIDRFLINANTAVLYFTVLCDGETLSAAEIEALYNDGKIVLSGNGMFRNPLLPCETVVSAEVVDGHGALALRVKRDQANLFACFTSMFLFNNKDVTFTYRSLSASDSFDMINSNPWSYIWRILVILVIIHVILWLIGFAFRKNFPKGALVGVSFAGRSDGNISSTDITINESLADRLKIHLRGFIPGNYFCVQKLNEITISGITLKPDFIHDPVLGRTTKFTIVSLPHGSVGLESCSLNAQAPKYQDFKHYIDQIAAGHLGIKLTLPLQQWRKIFVYHGTGTPLQIDHSMPLSGCYVIVNQSTHKVDRVVLFVKSN